MDDKDLVEQLTKGDEKAFRYLVEEYKQMVFSLGYRYVSNYHDAEEIAQEVFLEVYKSIAKFKGNSSLSTWLYQIAVSKSLDHLKFRKRKKRATENQFSISDHEGFDIKYTGVNPEESLENQEKKEALEEAISKLAPNQKTAFVLNKLEMKSYQETAEIMKTTVSSVESLLFRANKNLRKHLFYFYKK